MNFNPSATIALLLSVLSPFSASADPAQIERGAYLATIMDCAGCHMPRDNEGVPMFEAGLSGGTIGFELPGLGVFWAPNLTPSDSGLGRWTVEDIEQALRYGRRPDGRVLVPVMPWPSYGQMNDKDINDLIAFLVSMEPVEAQKLGPEPSGETAKAPFFRVTVPSN